MNMTTRLDLEAFATWLHDNEIKQSPNVGMWSVPLSLFKDSKSTMYNTEQLIEKFRKDTKY